MRLIYVGALLMCAGCPPENRVHSLTEPAGEPNPPQLEAQTWRDTHVQVGVPAVDVLWVIDNSCSMVVEQQAIRQNFSHFINYFIDAKVDYHVGVVSTDYGMTQGRLETTSGLKWVDSSLSDPVGVFGELALLGTEGHADERGRDQVFGAIETERDGYNSGFYREDAYLAVVAISDENDYSTNLGVTEFVEWFQGLKSDPSQVSFSSIVSPDPRCPGAIEPGTDYLEITRAVGGIEWSICDKSWDEALDSLGVRTAGMKHEFFLSQIPILSTIDVEVVEGSTVESFEQNVDWIYSRSRNSVTFTEYLPPPLSEVRLSYQLLADPVQGVEE